MNIPTIESILPQLCDFDPRNPDYADRRADYEDAGIELPAASAPDCGCNNCFYGRAPLASALLTLIGERA